MIDSNVVGAAKLTEPVNVGLFCNTTLPLPVVPPGKSPSTSARKAGGWLVPLVGPAKTKLADWLPGGTVIGLWLGNGTNGVAVRRL